MKKNTFDWNEFHLVEFRTNIILIWCHGIFKILFQSSIENIKYKNHFLLDIIINWLMFVTSLLSYTEKKKLLIYASKQ